MPDILLYDTLSRTKKPLRTPEPGKPLTLYVCGPTVYGRAHIGNMRPAVVFDTLYRLLRHVHGPENVRYARNITDIDDKIMAKAVAENRTPQAVAAEFEAAYFDDTAALGCLKPDFNPRATEHIEGAHGMIAMISARRRTMSCSRAAWACLRASLTTASIRSSSCSRASSAGTTCCLSSLRRAKKAAAKGV